MLRLILLFLCITLAPAYAKPTTIPKTLEPWVDWVLDDSPQYNCPFFYNKYRKKTCAWPSKLILNLQKQQGHFDSYWQVYNESYIKLPGNSKSWPQNVRVNNKPAIVIKHNNIPAIKLAVGTYHIQGNFYWQQIPDSLTIPKHIGLMTVSVLGKAINSPIIKNKQLWLKSSDTSNNKIANKSDHLNLQVFRKVYDDIPLQLITRLSLDVSGKQREIKLPYALLDGFIPINLNSPLPTRLESDGSLLVQVRPGRWNIELTAHHTQQIFDLTLNINNKDWPTSEIWSFAARPYQRLIEVEQVTSIDPSQNNVPTSWRNLPAFQVKQGDTMHFKLIRRGDPEPEPNNLSITRNLWLDFTGSGYSIQDKITGQITHDWRLNSLPEIQLGHVTLNNQTQLITYAHNKETQGIELRKGNVQLIADSRLENSITTLSATGWQQKFNQVKATLHLPPGWQVFAVSGVDNVPNSWITRWTLLDLFLVLITALAIKHLWNNYWGLFALIALALIWHENDAPRFIWINIIAAIALIKVLPQNNLLRFIKFYRSACWLALIIISIPFLINQIRTGLYPQLEKPWQHVSSNTMHQKGLSTAYSKRPVMAAEEDMLMESAAVMRSASISKDRILKKSANNYYPSSSSNFKRIDPKANLQTGLGLPQWQWSSIPLSWNGSVDSQQQVRFWLISPTANLILNCLRVIVVIILGLLMFGILNKNWHCKLSSSVINLCLLTCLILPSTPIFADYPHPDLLKELRQRLLKAPDCLPSCAQIPAMQLNISKQTLSINLQIHTQETIAVPLPTKFKQWLPNSITVNTLPAKNIIRDRQGILWLALPKGIHAIVLTGPTPLQSNFTLPLPLKPQYITHTSQHWSIEGLHQNGTSENQLHFTLIATADQPDNTLATLSPNILPAFIQIERTLQLGLNWHINTKVIRTSREATAVTLKVPLLSGESITSANMRNKNGYALVHMTANQRSTQWSSILAKSKQITLTAPMTEQWTEIWRADVSPIWHMESTGISVVHHQNQAGNWLPEWRPWPGESINLTIMRPAAIPGQTLTIDRSILTMTAGKRNLASSLKLEIRSSKGTQHSLTLPKNAILQSVNLNGRKQPIRQQQQTVTLPIKPGKQAYELFWHEAKAQASILTTPPLNLGLASVNTHLKIRLGQDRWVLLTTGPSLGPAVLFWGMIFVLALLAFALGKSHLTPLKNWQWFLLLIGLSQIPISIAFVVVAWLLALGLRKKNQLTNVNYFNFSQIVLVLLTFGSLAILFIAVKHGLLGTPDMQIVGNRSSAFALNWYQDRSAEILPTASVISIPLMSYRIMMLLWSLWLAIAVLNWLQWGWSCFATGGLWKKSKAESKGSVL
ncbi:MAG: hypothetical protein GQ581_07880 [Methyloprofundus sp.]|nr:hypothetical protein [Methyloprofundus sp.]